METIKKYWWKAALGTILIAAAYILYWKQKKGELLKPGYVFEREKYYKKKLMENVQTGNFQLPKDAVIYNATGIWAGTPQTQAQQMYELIEVTKREATYLGFTGI